MKFKCGTLSVDTSTRTEYHDNSTILSAKSDSGVLVELEVINQPEMFEMFDVTDNYKVHITSTDDSYEAEQGFATFKRAVEAFSKSLKLMS